MTEMKKPALLLMLVALCGLALLAAASGCTSTTATALPTPPATATVTSAPHAETPKPTGAPAEEGADAGPGLLEVAVTRTPAPTATPGRLEQEVTTLVARTGLARTTILGVAAADWINLGVSVLFVLIGYLLGTWLIRRLLPRLARRTPTPFDDAILQAVGSGLRWLVVVLTLHLATTRLTFVSAGLKSFLGDAYFVLGLAMVFRILWRAITLADTWYRERSIHEGREEELGPIITLLTRVGRVVVALVSSGFLLDWFGYDISAIAAALGIGGLAISLAAKDTIADAIAGFIILVDRPFRLGDRIEIQGVGTWGDVVEIGLRTTRIRTRDNRMVIVPNSIIGTNQVVNYSYPDPRYRIETHVGIGYGSDIEAVRRIIIDTVRGVEGVVLDKPVDALYVEMGDSAMIFRVRWWIGSYVDTRRMFDRVHTALQHALDAAGVDMPYPTQNFNLQVEQDTAGRLARAFRAPQESGTSAGSSGPERIGSDVDEGS
jgi:MscS family membrane protein